MSKRYKFLKDVMRRQLVSDFVVREPNMISNLIFLIVKRIRGHGQKHQIQQIFHFYDFQNKCIDAKPHALYN